MNSNNAPQPGQGQPQAAPSRGRIKAWGLTAVAAAMALAVLAPQWQAHSSENAPAKKGTETAAKVPVHTTTVQERDMPIAVTGMGTVVPIASVTIRTRVDGQLDKVEFREGQDVKAGQVLARLDARTYEAQLQQVLAQKAKDEASLANARVDLQRYTDLIRDEATTRQTLETQKSLVRQLEASVQNDAAQVSLARVNLSFTTIASPISGRVGARLVDPGNIVHAADSNGLLVVNQIDPIALQFTLPQEKFQAVNRAIKSGQTLSVQALDQGSREPLGSGELTLLNNQIDTSTGTITLKARLRNPDHALWPGQAVNARLVLGTRAHALVVPNSVVQRGQDGLFAYVVDAQGKAQMQSIEVSSTEGGYSVIGKGLQAGQRVVSDGQYRLTPGAQVVETGAAANQGKPGAAADSRAGASAQDAGSRSAA